MATDPFHAVGVELEQVGSELSFAGRRLAAAFEATPSVGAGAGAGAGSSGRLDLDNLPQPVDIVHRVRALEARVPELREELVALAAKKQAALEKLGVLLPRAQQAAADIAAALSVPQDASADAAYVGFSAMLNGVVAVGAGAGAGSLDAPAPTTRAASAPAPARQSARPTSRGKTSTARPRPTAVNTRRAPRQSVGSRPRTPSARRPGTPKRGKKKKKAPPATITPLLCDEESFKAVPSLVRGRCKFKDVEKVYGLVCDFAMEELRKLHDAASSGSSSRFAPATVQVADIPPMTVKMLSAKGGKVIGHTGDCVLKSLRSMGLLQITKAGMLLVQPDPDEQLEP